jgi:ribosome maturation factor RimP
VGRSSHASGDAALHAVVEPVVATLGLDLEGIDVQASGRRRRVSVVVDRDGGIDLDAIAEASRAVSDALDAAEAMGDAPYTLEVTSPGVDRPLTLPRHWRRNLTRRVRLHTTDGGVVEGRIESVDDVGVTLVADAGARRESETRSIPWPDVSRGDVQVEFTRPEPSALDQTPDQTPDQEEA